MCILTIACVESCSERFIVPCTSTFNFTLKKKKLSKISITTWICYGMNTGTQCGYVYTMSVNKVALHTHIQVNTDI